MLNNEIKYTQPDFDVVFGISKNNITKVVFENGKTMTFDNAFSVDLYIGIGYGIGTDDDDDELFYNDVAFRRFSFLYNNSFAMQTGLKIGFLF